MLFYRTRRHPALEAWFVVGPTRLSNKFKSKVKIRLPRKKSACTFHRFLDNFWQGRFDRENKREPYHLPTPLAHLPIKIISFCTRSCLNKWRGAKVANSRRLVKPQKASQTGAVAVKQFACLQNNW